MRADLEKLLRRLDLFVINEDESLLLTGERKLVLAGQHLRKMGPKSGRDQKGRHGSLLFHRDGYFAI